MKRREFIALISGVGAALPLTVRAQQSVMPSVGFLNAAFAAGYAQQLSAFLKGLAEAGYVDGQNVTIQYHWAEGHNDRLPSMAADLVRSQVTVIAATTTPAALAAKAATSTIPIVFEIGSDPIRLGLVASLNRPGGNMTGTVSMASQVIAAKGLELLHELIPTGHVIGLLVNPTDPAVSDPQERQVLSVARTLGGFILLISLRVSSPIVTHSCDALFANGNNATAVLIIARTKRVMCDEHR
jgi:putative ABC transport system substrate-binding protein